MLGQLQTTIQNSQLAGQMRVEGIYNLQRLTVDSYSVSTVPSPAPAPLEFSGVPSPTPLGSPGIAPIPAAQLPVLPSTAQILPPSPAEQTTAPELGIALASRQAPLPAPADSPQPRATFLPVLPMLTPSPASAGGPDQPIAPAESPSVAPAPEGQQAAPALVPAPQPSSAPLLAPAVLRTLPVLPDNQSTLPPFEQASLAPSQQATLAPFEQASLAPAQQPSSAPAPSTVAAQQPFPGTLFAPESEAPGRSAAPDFAAGSLVPGVAPVPAPLAPVGEIDLTLALQGGNALDSSNASVLQTALATLIGNLDPSQVRVQNASSATPPSSATASSGKRRLLGFPIASIQHSQGFGRVLLQSSTVPVTINAGSNAQEVTQQLQNLSSSGNLTSALRAAGLNVTNAHIVSVNGQPVLRADVEAPQSSTGQAPSSPLPALNLPNLAPVVPAFAPSGVKYPRVLPVPAISDRGWNNSIILGAVIGGVIGGILLVILVVCCGSRLRATRVRRKFPPAKGIKGPKDTSGSSSSSDDVEAGSYLDIPPLQRSEASSQGDRSMRKILQAELLKEEADHHTLLLSSRDLTIYQGQFRYYVPSKEELETADIIQVHNSDDSETEIQAEPSASSSDSKQDPRTALVTASADLADIAAAGVARLQDLADEASQDRGTPPGSEEGGNRLAQPGSKTHLADFAVMQLVASGNLYAGKYILEEGCIKGDRAIVVAAKEKSGQQRSCLCKFITSEADYDRELQLHELLPEDAPIPGVIEKLPAGLFPGTGLPACIVSSVGDYSLSQWHAYLGRQPDAAQKRAAFHMICKALAALHRRNIVHGNLTPDNILWFDDSTRIKLSSFSFWAFDGAPIPLHPALRYAPPETVTASASGKRTMPASYALDCWSLGAIAYDIFCRAPVFDSSYSDGDVIQCLLGNQPLPWEMDGQQFEMITNKDARNLVRNLLRRDAGLRWDIEQVLGSPFFSGLPPMQRKPSSLKRNPSYPKQALPRTTVNPLQRAASFQQSEQCIPAGLAGSQGHSLSTEKEAITPAQKASKQTGALRPLTTVSPADSAPQASILAAQSERDEEDNLQMRRTNVIQPAAAYPSGSPAWSSLFNGASPPSTPGSLRAAGADRSIPNVLFSLSVVDNPAYSADGGSLPGRQSRFTSEAAAGASGPPAGVSEKAEVPPAAGTSQQHSTRLTSATDEKQEVGATLKDSPAASVSEELQGNGGLPLGHSQAEANGMASSKTDLLRTVSLAGGHSRAASVAGWEVLETFEDAHSEWTSQAGDSGPFTLRPISYSALPTLKGSALVVGVCIEEIRLDGASKDCSTFPGGWLLDAVATGRVPTLEVPMVPNKGASLDEPVFMLRLGSAFVLRIHLAAGSRRGWMPLMVTGPVKCRIGFAKSDEGQALEIVETDSDVSKWRGYAVWNSNVERVSQTAGKFGQQTRMIVTTDYKCKGCSEVVTMEHEIYAVFCSAGQRLPTTSWQRRQEFENAVKGLAWARESALGVATFAKIQRPGRLPNVSDGGQEQA